MKINESYFLVFLQSSVTPKCQCTIGLSLCSLLSLSLCLYLYLYQANAQLHICQSLSFFWTCVYVCSWSMHHCLCLCLSFGSVFVFFFFIGPMHNCTCASLLDRMSLSLSLCSVDQCTIAQLHMCQPSRQDIGPRLRASPSSMSDPLPIKNIRFSQQGLPPWILNFSCH